MTILISPAMIERAATRLILSEQVQPTETPSSPGEEAHIYNLYEELSMPLSDIIEIGRLGLEGRLENVQEKMDGQFLAFTVVDSQLKFFTKMDLQGQAAKEKKLQAIRAGVKGGGMTLDQIASTYTGGRSNIADGFAIAYDALDHIVLPYEESLFRNGEVVIVSQIMVSQNPNTILYDDDSLRTVLAISLTEEPVSQDALDSFKVEMKDASTDAFTMDEVPTAQLIRGLEEDDSIMEQIERDLGSVVSDAGLSVSSNTVGDYVKSRLEKLLADEYDFIPRELIPDVADRFMTGRGKVSLRLKKVVSSDDYKIFRELDKAKSRIVQEAIIPLENIIQRLGIMIIDKIDLALTASNQEDLLGFVKDARAAFEKGEIIGDEKTLEGIRIALARLEENEDLFTRATEGIVFTYNNKTYKLTGLFTPINKLRGFFGRAMGREGFGKAELPQESEIEGEKMYSDQMLEMIKRASTKMMLEGGNAFEGTSVISRDNILSTLNHFKENILDDISNQNPNLLPDPDYEMLGSTGKKSQSSDLDIAIERPDGISKSEFRSTLTQEIQSRLETGAVRLMPGGNNLAVKYPVYFSGGPGLFEEAGGFVQIDIMPAESVSSAAFLMAGVGDDKVKGVYRNMLLNLIAKRMSVDQSEETGKIIKYSLATPGGLEIKSDGQVIVPRTSDPERILQLLGINAHPDQVLSFDGLLDVMLSDERLTSYLPRYREYLGRRLERDPENAGKSVSAIEGVGVQMMEEKNYNLSTDIRDTINMILSVSEKSLLSEETEKDEDMESAVQPEQLRLLTPAAYDPEDSITPSWLASHSVPDDIYDNSTNTFDPSGIPALLMGYEDSPLGDEGEKFEHGVISYADMLGLTGMERIGGEGEDLRRGNRTYESKKSKNSSPTLMFNSTFPKSRPQHFYLFTLNVPSASLIRDVADQLKSELGIRGRWNQMSDEDKQRLTEAWLNSQDTSEKTVSDLEQKIQKIDGLINDPKYWRQRVEVGKTKSGARKTKPVSGPLSFHDDEVEIDDEFEEEQLSLFEGVRIGGVNFDTPEELERYKKSLMSQIGSQTTPGPIAKKLRALGTNIKVYIVPSSDLRVAIMQSAFPGAFKGPDQIFDPQTGAVVKGGEEKIVTAIRGYLDNFGLEYKIAEKIAPALIQDLISGLGPSETFEPGWTVKMGLLGIRIKVYIEPRGTQS